MRKVLALILISCAGFISAQDESEGAPMQVVAAELVPCVMGKEPELAGFAIDLWKALTDELGLEYSVTAKLLGAALADVEEGRAAVALGCISITNERELVFDFTHPIAEGGLLAVSLTQRGFLPRFSNQSKMLLLVLFGLVVFFAHLMWWSDRGNPVIHDSYFPGIFEAIWFSIVTMSTVGYGDIAPRKWPSRIIALLIILLGVASFGLIVGQFAADAVKTQAQHPVESHHDLHKYRIGTKAGTATIDFLNSQGLEYATFTTLDEAIVALDNEEVQLVVHDSVAIQYQVVKHGGLVQTGPSFNAHHLGFALPQGSPLTESINQALLKLQENGRYATILNQWFAWDS